MSCVINLTKSNMNEVGFQVSMKKWENFEK